MFVLNIRTEYKYYIVLTITKIIFGVGVPPFLLIFVDYPIPLMMVNTILFMVATALPNISRLLKHMEPRTIAPAYMNPYTYSHFNRPGMHRPPNVAYMQPQQPYYAMPPNMKNNIPGAQPYNPYGQNVPQYYPPTVQQQQHFQQKPNAINNENSDAPLPSVDEVQGGESVNQVDKPN